MHINNNVIEYLTLVRFVVGAGTSDIGAVLIISTHSHVPVAAAFTFC